MWALSRDPRGEVFVQFFRVVRMMPRWGCFSNLVRAVSACWTSLLLNATARLGPVCTSPGLDVPSSVGLSPLLRVDLSFFPLFFVRLFAPSRAFLCSVFIPWISKRPYLDVKFGQSRANTCALSAFCVTSALPFDSLLTNCCWMTFVSNSGLHTWVNKLTVVNSQCCISLEKQTRVKTQGLNYVM